MTTWNKIGDVLKTLGGGEGSNKFIKFEDGGSVEGIIIGDPFEFWYSFNRKEYLPYVEGQKKPGKDFTFRFRVNFAIEDNGSWKVLILEQGSKMLNTLNNIQEEDGLDMKLKIKRKGTGLDTEYIIIGKGKVDMKIFDGLPLNNLDPMTKTEVDEDDGIPF